MPDRRPVLTDGEREAALGRCVDDALERMRGRWAVRSRDERDDDLLGQLRHVAVEIEHRYTYRQRMLGERYGLVEDDVREVWSHYLWARYELELRRWMTPAVRHRLNRGEDVEGAPTEPQIARPTTDCPDVTQGWDIALRELLGRIRSLKYRPAERAGVAP